MHENPKRVCMRCLLREMEEADKKEILRYKDAIREADRVPETLYEKRLQICKECDLLNAGTCNACGCYVELRALAQVSRCPHKKW